ncbi:Ohr subfamily peroxiredoxin [Novosphingobium sp. PhB165]|uniref:Ohr family peroxiredoxin n=1 Tax=Novosphingobium sp. PhB165 TaxID=2485105 RepID=UPI0010446CB6|nr:Ohr family peroxiredoxin [Novosphingobium sp. PhB165]TCM20846.1 Ohr subfamily peroxiredoxin [Novosphingobium sp. PhB165]
MDPIYTAQATVLGGRSGCVSSCDGRLRVDLSTPAALGGDDGRGTNPEQLFAAAYAACFLATLRMEAQERAVALASDSNVTATVRLTAGDASGPVLAVSLSLDLPGLPPELAEVLAARAHARCPYSKAVCGNVEVRIDVT